MKKLNAALLTIAGTAAALAAINGPASAQDPRYGQDEYEQRSGRNYDDRSDDARRDRGRLHGPGVRYLMPQLRESWQGRRFVRDLSGPNGVISEKEARRANQRFLRIADRDRDGRVSDREARRALGGRDDWGGRDR